MAIIRFVGCWVYQEGPQESQGDSRVGWGWRCSSSPCWSRWRLPGYTHTQKSLSWTFRFLLFSLCVIFQSNQTTTTTTNKTLVPGTCFFVPSLSSGWGRGRDGHLELSDFSTSLLDQLHLPVLSGSLPMPRLLWSLPGIPSWIWSLPSSSHCTETLRSRLEIHLDIITKCPDFGYACVKLWLQLLGSVSGPWECALLSQGQVWNLPVPMQN